MGGARADGGEIRRTEGDADLADRPSAPPAVDARNLGLVFGLVIQAVTIAGYS